MAASTDVVIWAPLRAPVGRMGGALAPLAAAELATVVLHELVRRTGLSEGDVDDGYAKGESPAIGRITSLDAGLGTGVPGLQIDRRCGSGLQAVRYAAGQVATGAAGLVVAGGVESMSNVEHYALGLRTGVKQGGIRLMNRLDRARETAGGLSHPAAGGMIETAENVRKTYHISRAEQDELAVRSHHRAVAAHEAGRFADELVAVTVPGKRGKPDTTVERDEHPRADVTLEGLFALRAIRAKLDPESTVTAGNASGQNDSAAICVVTTRAVVEKRGLAPLLALRSWAFTGCGPEVMGIGPVRATAAALDRAGLLLDEIDLIELNEAFAAPALAVLCEWKIDPLDERLNPNGSGISLGPRSAPPVPASRPPPPTKPAGAPPAMPWKPCASAAARAWPRSSRPCDDRSRRPRHRHRPRRRSGHGAVQFAWFRPPNVGRPARRAGKPISGGPLRHSGTRLPPVPGGPYAIDDLADDLLALLDRLGVERAHVVGLSLGGMTAMRVAARNPERFDRLALLCTGTQLPLASNWTEHAATVRTMGSAAVAGAVVQCWLTRQYLVAQPISGPLVRRWSPPPSPRATPAAARRSPHSTCATTWRRLSRQPWPSAAPRTPPAKLAVIADGVKDGRLLAFPRAAHLANAEQPGTITPALIEHLEQR